MKKYKLVEHDESKAPKHLKQIEALRDIPEIGVKKGDLGGFLESETNLSHEGICWVYGSAQVYDSAWVYGSAKVYGSAQVYGSAWVSGSAWVFGSAKVFGSARVYGLAEVYGSAQVFGSAEVYGLARVLGFNTLTHTNQYQVIQGFKYPITVTLDSINVGCKQFTFDQLDEINSHEEFSDSEIARMKAMIEVSMDQIMENEWRKK